MHIINRFKKQAQNSPFLQEITGEDMPGGDPVQEQSRPYYSPLNPSGRCVVCSAAKPKYTCPHCRQPYCSSGHYKSHNLFCTEQFYQKQVQSVLKATKSNPKQKKQAVEMVRAHSEAILKQESQVAREQCLQQIPEDRLIEIMGQIEQDREVRLSSVEEICFKNYVERVTMEKVPEEDNTQDKTEDESQRKDEFIGWTPFWEVEDGVCQYYMIEQMSIQDYNASAHKELLGERAILSKVLKQDTPKLTQLMRVTRLSSLFNHDILKLISLGCLFFRLHDGEPIPHEYLAAYAQTDPLHHPDYFVWHHILFQDVSTILKSKYLCLQMLMRLLGIMRKELGSESSDQVLQPERREVVSSKSDNASGRKYRRELIKITKKMELAISYVNDLLFRDSHEQMLEMYRIEGEIPQQGSVLLGRNREIIQKEFERQKERCRQIEEDNSIGREARTDYVEKSMKGILLK